MDLKTSKKGATILKKFHPNRNSMVAYAKFESQEGADAAVKANGMVWNDHHLRIDYAENNGKLEDSYTSVFVGQLPFSEWDLVI